MGAITVGYNVGALVETLISAWLKVVGATKASVLTTTGAPRSAARALASGLSSPVTACVRSATRAAKTSSAEAAVGWARCI